jgi:hypothetical protein
MAVKTIDCVECGASVPYGRLSCSACGALLASVSGVRLSSVAVASAEPVQAVRVAPARAARPRRPAAVAREVPVPAAVPVVEPEISMLAPDEPVMPEPVEPVEVSMLAPDERVEVSVLAFDQPVTARPGPTAPPAAAAPVPMLEPRSYQVHTIPVTNMTALAAPPPGHYRPPTAPPAAVASAALSWANADTSTSPEPSPDAGASGAVAAGVSKPGVVDVARFVEIAGWFVVFGAAMSVLGFMLPWSRAVIGSSGIGGYFDSWGLASPTHLFVVLGILQTPLPAWLRSGVLGLASGALVVGLTWPYLIGPLGADVGVLIAAIGALALVIGGAVASWATRHAGVDPLV